MIKSWQVENDWMTYLSRLPWHCSRSSSQTRMSSSQPKSLQRIFSGSQATQILHVSQSHWVCSSKIFPSPEVCDLYDSMPPVYTSTLTCQVAAIMKYQSPSFKLRHIDVQHQSGGQDCGLFSIAFIYAVCTGKDPHLCSFDQLQIRCHLRSCLQSQTMSEFSSSHKTTTIESHKDEIRSNLQCLLHM